MSFLLLPVLLAAKAEESNSTIRGSKGEMVIT